ncbi:hypothetical protein [Thiolapillus sp.]
MGNVKALWKGDVALWKTFWIFGIAVFVAYNFLFSGVFFLLSGTSLALGKIVLTLLLFLAGISIVYFVVILVSIWRSAGKYTGNRLWSLAARGAVLLVVIGNVYAAYQTLTEDGWNMYDPGKDSSNIARLLSYEKTHPYVGFWKRDCSNNFGLAIDKAGVDLYSVSFCSPQDCFKPNTYRPNTSLVNDSSYRMVDEDSIEVRDGADFFRYYRCKH